MSLIPWFSKKEKSSSLIDFKNWDIFSSKFPTIDISENDKEITVLAELPGMTEKDIEVNYLDGVLTIKGEKKEEKKEENKNFFHKESWHGVFSRSIPLGNHLLWDQASASFKDGKLTINLPKKPDSGKKITINVE
jgi:HSP20 family protein